MSRPNDERGPEKGRNLEDLDLRTEAREDADLRAEMEAHLEHRVDELITEGLDPEAARARARAEFGDVDRITREARRERTRERRARSRFAGGRDLFRDLRYGLRQLHRAPGFAAVAIATLALGIGATATIFGVVRSVVLDPLPFADPEEIVEVLMLTPVGDDFSVAEPSFLDMRERLERFDGVAAMAGSAANLQAPGQTRSIDRIRVSADFFPVLGTPLVRGRAFLPEEDLPGTPASVAMISESFWRTRMAADPEVLDRSITMDGQSWPIVGVYPTELEIILGEDGVVTPLGADPANDRGEHYLTVIARLAPGSTEGTAAEELDDFAAWQSSTFAEDRGWGARIQPVEESLIGATMIRAGWVLLAAGALLLLTACVNVAGLLLVRATVRGTEMRVRRALGAATARLGRQLFTESAVLAAVGGALGLVLASLAIPAVRGLAIGRIPRVEEATLDPVTTAVALGAVGLAAVIFGLAPLGLVRASSSLRTRGRGSGEGARGLRQLLVGLQVSISVVLLIGTGLLFRSFAELAAVDPGFEPEGAYTFDVSMPDQTWDWRERNALLSTILTRVEELPGVRVAGATAIDPFSGFALANNVAPADDLPAEAKDFPAVHWRAVTSSFFQAAGIPLLAGRVFEDTDILPRTDDSWGRRPVMIDDRLATDFFGSPSDAIGKRIVWGNPNGSHLTIIGVVGTLRDVTLDEEPSRMVYRLYGDLPWASMVGIARIDGDAPGMAAAIRDAVVAAAPGIGTPEVTRLEETVDRALAQPRFNVVLLGAFALSGLVLALVGLYGSTAFEVRQRFREIGIRLSLGADAASIQRLIVRERIALTAVGVAVGCAVAFLLRGTLEALLFGVAPGDPLTWIAGVGLVLLTAVLAAWVPARRATRVDPRDALNAE